MLSKSNVQFNEIEHTYTLDGVVLSGITSILSKYLFPKQYNGVPADILEAARERGTLVHSQVQMSVDGFDIAEPTDEFISYKNLNLTFCESEYLVSDNVSVASSIDLVEKVDDTTYNLYDIKTTSTLHIEYLSWQLSIYAYLFELQNPTLKVGSLKAIHLRGKDAKVVDINRLPNEYVLSLLDAYKSGANTFTNPLTCLETTDEEALEKAVELEQFIINLETRVKEYKEQQDKVKELLMQLMDSRSLKKIETERCIVTRKADSTRESVDSKALKERFADVYNEVKRITNVKGSITIKLKQADEKI